jgi:enoyl-[acyl-carrier-protein] reductase (NADH)
MTYKEIDTLLDNLIYGFGKYVDRAARQSVQEFLQNTTAIENVESIEVEKTSELEQISKQLKQDLDNLKILKQ